MLGDDSKGQAELVLLGPVPALSVTKSWILFFPHSRTVLSLSPPLKTIIIVIKIVVIITGAGTKVHLLKLV